MPAPPIPYFGSKRRAAATIWQALGNPGLYAEPFAGSLAVLLARPLDGPAPAEIAVDSDGFVMNFWRWLRNSSMAGIQAALTEVDGPYSEDDIEAQHRYLVGRRARIQLNLRRDDRAFDSRAAVYWWRGTSAWLGSGWATAIDPDAVSRQRPHIDRTLKGLYARGCTDDRILALGARLSNVMLLSGDWDEAWRRCVTDSILRRFDGDVGIFLDPPYSHATGRTRGLYGNDGSLSAEVEDFALTVGLGDVPSAQIGDLPGVPRIVVAGYASEYPQLAAHWRMVDWRRPNGYGGAAAQPRREQDVLFLSPACLPVDNPRPVG